MSKRVLIISIISIIIFILIVVGILFGVYINIRNNIIAKSVKTEEAWAQVQNVYQRRLDLVPNLAESAKAYLKLEKDIFQAIADARKGIQDAKTPAELENATSEIDSFIRDFRVTVEDTPELKASETIRDLMNQLEGTENRITVERQRFNEAVRDYNIYIKSWPNNIVANRLGYTEKSFFQAEEGAEQAPEIDLNLE
jgi:LemA protein